ncbi:M4 family metallopeptidase [Butyrivibrio sp. LC3010]|uniref:M4 family metallopeptidase n=1 Tax=Butyrivibrio sp. LC3010 TaxID=1280680 RepID=UPI0003FEB21D|nr:M4 family metallopeptidase [Butyrivibrio sp. LC3010]
MRKQMKKLFVFLLVFCLAFGPASVTSQFNDASVVHAASGKKAKSSKKSKAGTKAKLSQKKATLIVGQSLKLTMEGASKVKWSSSNKKVATVSKGNVKAKKAGKATITAKVGNKKYNCKVTVKIGLTDSALTLTKGEQKTIKLKGAKAKSFKSSNLAVATVTNKGLISAVGAGNAVITVKGKNRKSYKCNVTVQEPPVENPVLSANSLDLFLRDSSTLTVTGTTKTVQWSSSDKKIVTVDGNGNVYAANVGQATVTAQAGSSTLSCSVTVKYNPDKYYNVTFNANGGTPVPEAQRVQEGKKVSVPATTPHIRGKQFVNWYNGNSAYNFNSPVTSDLNIVAKWRDSSSTDNLDDNIIDLGDIIDLETEGAIDVQYDENGVVGSIDGKFTNQKVTDANSAAAVMKSAKSIIAGNNKSITIDAANISVKEVASASGNEKFFKLSQKKNGIDVVGSEVVILAKSGSGEVTGLHNSFDSRINDAGTYTNTSQDTAIETAINAVLNDQALTEYLTSQATTDVTVDKLKADLKDSLEAEARKVIIQKDENTKPRLTWEVTVKTKDEILASALDDIDEELGLEELMLKDESLEAVSEGNAFEEEPVEDAQSENPEAQEPQTEEVIEEVTDGNATAENVAEGIASAQENILAEDSAITQENVISEGNTFVEEDAFINTNVLAEAPTEEIISEETPAAESTIEEAPVVESTLEDTPVVESILDEVPVDERTIEETPSADTTLEEAPVVENATEEAPVEAVTDGNATSDAEVTVDGSENAQDPEAEPDDRLVPLNADDDPMDNVLLADGSSIVLPVIYSRYYILANSYNTSDSDNARSGDIWFMISEEGAWSAGTLTSDDYRGAARTFNVEKDGTKNRLKDTVRKITTYKASNKSFLGYRWSSLPGKLEEAVLVNSTAVSAHANMELVYDYYKNKLGRNSFDGHGAEIKVSYDGINSGFSDNDMANAYWTSDKQQFVFGNVKHYAAALDVIGHEFTHAVVAYIVGDGHKTSLTYQGESGALNEAYADIMGSLIENKSGDGRWLIAEDSDNSQGRQDGAIRSMKAPKSVGSNNKDHYTDRYLGDDDHGGVHWNSGIFNRAAYLMMTNANTSTVSADTWAKVFYNSLYYLSCDSSFLDGRRAVISSAKRMGISGGALQAIKEAFDTVGIVERDVVHIRLTWGETPRDLDSHLVKINGNGTNKWHIYYSHKKVDENGKPVADLDYDDTTSFGPENTTIYDMTPGVYYFFVHDYTTGSNANSTRMAASDAKVQISKAGEHLRTYYIDPSSKGTIWMVCRIQIGQDGTVNIQNKNIYSGGGVSYPNTLPLYSPMDDGEAVDVTDVPEDVDGLFRSVLEEIEGSEKE